jgi:hypothetical protein
MRKSVLAVVGIAVAIIIVGFIIKGQKGSNPGGPDSASVTNPPGPFAEKGTPKNPEAPSYTHRTNRILRATNTEPSHSAPPPATNTAFMTNWEEKLDTILSSDKLDPDKAKEMIDMFPKLSPEAQEEIAHHISNLTPDENYSLGQFLTNSALPEAVLDVFTEDVLNRPNSIKLPLLLEVAKDPNHPKASESKDILELFLENDYGNDWTAWQASLDKWLKDNPD